jgi:hypothetical protein
MTATRLDPTSPTTTPPDRPTAAPDTSAARATGVFYLALAVTGGLGFLVVRPMVVGDTAAATALSLEQHELLARTGVALEMATVVTQALAAIWFFRLFRPVAPLAAGAVAVFGLVNSVALMGSAAAMATSLTPAVDGLDAAPHLLWGLSEGFWAVGNLFFGLWLVPMGLCVLRAGTMPRLLGRVLVVGGAGYVLSAFVIQLLPDLAVVPELLVVPATVGELWMIGFLLVRGAGRTRA